MRLQDVADGLDRALDWTTHLPDSPEKEALRTELAGTLADLTRFSEAMQATLDDLKNRYAG